MDILGEIVKVEKDIEQVFQKELKKAQDTLVQVKEEAEKELKYEEEKAQSLLTESLEENRRKVKKRQMRYSLRRAQLQKVIKD